jgi:hypothetical protein
MRKVFGIVALSLGLVLVAAAALVSWVIAPKLTVLPADTDTQRVYAGNAVTLVNPTSLTGTTFGPGVLHDVAVTVIHYTKVLRTDGDSALVSDARSLHVPGFTIADFDYRFSVDRTSMGPSDAFPSAPPHEGVTFNFPLDTQKHDYTGWVADTQSTTHLEYVSEGSRGGEDAYIFKTAVPTTEIRDPQLLAVLPKTLTKEQILELTPSLGLTTEQLLANQKILDRLPDPVPVTYTYSLEATYFVEPVTGIILDTTRHETRTAAFVDGDDLIPATPVMDMTYQAQPTTLAQAVEDARDSSAQIHLIRTTIPWVALISGIVLMLIGAGLLLFRRRPTGIASAGVSGETRAPVSHG